MALFLIKNIIYKKLNCVMHYIMNEMIIFLEQKWNDDEITDQNANSEGKYVT